ncbi:MAG: hypothetical protein U0L85_05675 [Bacilli bacterium]|nr:hypothetical protein [Bacilli bacterium]
MKQYIVDLLLVLLILCIGQIYFDDHNVEKTMFNRNLAQFEQQVEENEQVTSYVTPIDREDNQISLFFLYVSKMCVKVIEYIVYIFSQIISMLFTIMVY